MWSGEVGECHGEHGHPPSSEFRGGGGRGRFPLVLVLCLTPLVLGSLQVSCLGSLVELSEHLTKNLILPDKYK